MRGTGARSHTDVQRGESRCGHFVEHVVGGATVDEERRAENGVVAAPRESASALRAECSAAARRGATRASSSRARLREEQRCSGGDRARGCRRVVGGSDGAGFRSRPEARRGEGAEIGRAHV